MKALNHPMKQAKTTVASATLMGYSDIMAMPVDSGIAMAPHMIPACRSRARYLAWNPADPGATTFPAVTLDPWSSAGNGLSEVYELISIFLLEFNNKIYEIPAR
jgi:hypothetical protein